MESWLYSTREINVTSLHLPVNLPTCLSLIECLLQLKRTHILVQRNIGVKIGIMETRQSALLAEMVDMLKLQAGSQEQLKEQIRKQQQELKKQLKRQDEDQRSTQQEQDKVKELQRQGEQQKQIKEQLQRHEEQQERIIAHRLQEQSESLSRGFTEITSALEDRQTKIKVS